MKTLAFMGADGFHAGAWRTGVFLIVLAAWAGSLAALNPILIRYLGYGVYLIFYVAGPAALFQAVLKTWTLRRRTWTWVASALAVGGLLILLNLLLVGGLKWTQLPKTAQLIGTVFIVPLAQAMISDFLANFALRRAAPVKPGPVNMEVTP